MYRLSSMIINNSVILLVLQCDWNVVVRKVADPQQHSDTNENVDCPQLNFDTREDVDWPAWFARMSQKGNTSDPKETARTIIAGKKLKEAKQAKEAKEAKEAEEAKKQSKDGKKRSRDKSKKKKIGGHLSDENDISTETTQKNNPRRSPRKTKTNGTTVDDGVGVGDALEQHQLEVVMAVTSPQRSSNDGLSDDEVNEAATKAASKPPLIRNSGDGSTKNRTNNKNRTSSSPGEDDDYEASDVTSSEVGSSEVEALFTKAPSNGNRKSPAGRKVKAASPAVSSSALSRESSVQSIPAHQAENDSIALFTHCIEATHDIVPVMNGPKPRPFMYWLRHKDYLCAMMLIKRYPELCEMAETHYGSVQIMAKKWAVPVRTKANNERAIQIRYLKMIWLSNKSKFAIALNALDTELEVDNASEITPSPTVQASGINSIAELRDLIKSSEMYKNATVFNLFCLGLESGMLKMARTMQPTRIEKLITIAHEAHFRLELWLALSKQGFRHKTTGAWTDKRKEYWDEFCQLVAKDRKDNSDTACNNRLGEMHEDNALSSEEDDDDKAGLNPEYF